MEDYALWSKKVTVLLCWEIFYVFMWNAVFLTFFYSFWVSIFQFFCFLGDSVRFFLFEFLVVLLIESEIWESTRTVLLSNYTSLKLLLIFHYRIRFGYRILLFRYLSFPLKPTFLSLQGCLYSLSLSFSVDHFLCVILNFKLPCCCTPT